MNRFLKILLPTIALSMAANLQATEPQEGTGTAAGMGRQEPYILVWQDLFDSGELNSNRWNIEVNGKGGGNNELQYYTDSPANVHVGDDGQGNGCLILTARREEFKSKHFTSGRVNSLGLISFTHGKIEAAIKLPKTANGLWPAFWMMGDDYPQVGWPRCGETDIMEFGNVTGINAGTQDRYFNGACHWGEAWPQSSYANATTRGYSLQDGEFHIFTCIWDENEVRMYVDLDRNEMQNPYFRMTFPCTEPEEPKSPGNYFHKNNFILFNLAIGGDFTGIHKAENITALNDENGQKASMYINYVKIYQKGDPSEASNFTDPGDPKDSGILNPVAQEEGTLDFDGATLITDQDGGIEVFDLAGRLCIMSHAQKLSTAVLSSGLYIARAGSTALKIVIP